MGVEQRLRFTAPLYVSDYFVSSDIGSDSNTGRSELQPFATLGAALDAVDTGGVPSAIHILDRNTYTVTEAVPASGERVTTVELILIGNDSTLQGDAGGIVWKLNKSRIEGMNVDGTNLTFRPTGATTGQTDHIHTWYKIENPETLYQTIASDPTPNRWIINAGRIKGNGSFIDADNASATFYHVICNDIGLDFSTANPEYIFIGNGAGVIINYMGLNTDNSNTGAGVGKVIKLTNSAQAYLIFNCFGGGAANGGDIDSGAKLFVFGGSVSGEPLTWSGTGEIHDHSMVDGINFANMNATAGLALGDLVNIHDIGTGRQVSATLSDLKTLIDTATLAATLIAGNTSGANDISMDTLQGIIFGNALRKIVDDGTNITYLSNGIHQFLAKVMQKIGAGSGLTASTLADNVVIDSDILNLGLSILSAAGGNANIFFGETGNSNQAAKIQHIGSVNELRINVAGGALLRFISSVLRYEDVFEIRGNVGDKPQFKIYSNTTSQGNPLMQLYDTTGAVSWNWYNSVLRASGRDTKFQSVAGFDVIIARSTGATGTKFDDTGEMTNFYAVGIGADPNAVTILDLTSTTKGFRAPRMTAAQASAITAIDGLMVYVTTTDATFTAVGYWAYEAGQWNHLSAAGSGSTASKGNMYISTSASTTISVADTPVKVAGTYDIENVADFDEPADGRLRYTGASTACFSVTASISMTGGNNATYSFYIAKNGTVITSSRVQRKLGTGADVGALPLVGSVELATNDYIEVFVENNGGTDDVTAEFMYLTIK